MSERSIESIFTKPVRINVVTKDEKSGIEVVASQITTFRVGVVFKRSFDTEKEVRIFFPEIPQISIADIQQIGFARRAGFDNVIEEDRRSDFPFESSEGGYWWAIGNGNDGDVYTGLFRIEEFTQRKVQLLRKQELDRIENLEKAGRYEEAALEYEKLQLYEKAGEMRRKDKMVIVRNTNISVDLNYFLSQIREGGVVAVYSCPNCGGKLKVDKNASLEQLRTCVHCGNEIQSMEIAAFLRTALS